MGVGGYFPTNIDILLATLANPMAAKLAADRVAEGCGRPGIGETPATSNLERPIRGLLNLKAFCCLFNPKAFYYFSLSPDGGQAPTW
jgi:hypothetical protein